MHGPMIADQPLKDARHEKFAQLRTEGRAQSEAYAGAGFRSHKGNAARLAGRPDVRARVEWLKSQAAERTGDTVTGIVRQLNEARDLAQENGNPAAMVAAIMAKAKVLGLIVNHHQVGIKTLDEMNEPELRALLGEE